MKPTQRFPQRVESLDQTLDDIRFHARGMLAEDRYDGTAAVLLGLVALAERQLRAEREGVA